MTVPLFNPQTGDHVRSQVRQLGVGSVTLSDGSIVRARHYALTGDVALDDCYDGASNWVALYSIGRDGSTIVYRRAV